MMRMTNCARRSLAVLLLSMLTWPLLSAAEKTQAVGSASPFQLHWRGVLGNSGEAGDTLVPGSVDQPGREGGLNPLFDAAGTLWA